ncbi:FAD/NAD(P)-binding protein [Leifsonia sp. CL147]|uniref:FAD/NAD(P)-binding protein n=2 Tax=unclassified Leifsonia TaxID=2663824 RepID=UPI001FCD01BB|nr:FAD/NAD(P)-binding protein [Leifsonia sp. CL147]
MVVGGRLTGTAAFIQLATQLSPGSRVTIVDPALEDYPAVFGDPAPHLLCNTSAHIGSLLPEVPDDFLSYLPPSVDPNGVPRYLVGRYAASRFQHYRRVAASRGVETVTVRGTVTSITRAPDGYLVRLAAGAPLTATDVILAMGPGPARLVPGPPSVSPYPTTPLLDRTPERAVVVGMGSGGIDAALVLANAGVEVTIVSRSGYFPAVRTRTLRTGTVMVEPGREQLHLRTVLERFSIDRQGSFAGFPEPAGHPADQLRRDLDAASPEDTPWQDALADVVYLLGSRSLQLSDPPAFVWRHLTSVMATTATMLNRHIETGAVTPARLDDVDVEAFPLVVSAIGTDAYPLHGSSTGLRLGPPTAGTRPITQLDDTLRVVLPGRQQPERIWAIGPTAGIARLTSSALCVAVAQAREAVEQVTSRPAESDAEAFGEEFAAVSA